METSVANNSSFQNYPHPDDHTIRTNIIITKIIIWLGQLIDSCLNHTWGNATWLHFVPVVNKLNAASPWWTPDWEPWNANQSMVVLYLKPQPPCTRQALKLFVVTSSTQRKAESWTLDDSFPWLIEANTRTGVPLEKLLLNDTGSQWKPSTPTCWMLSFPLSTPKK